MRFGNSINRLLDSVVISIIIIILSGIIILSPFRDSSNYLLIFLLPSIFLVFAVKVRYILFLFPILLYVKYDIPIFTLSQLVIYFVLIKILIGRDKIEFGLSKELLAPVLIFLISIIPSYINLTKPSHIIYSQNIVLFFLVVLTLNIYRIDLKLGNNILFIFVLMGLINSLDIMVFAPNSENRYFGFSGVSFVDYAGISIMFLIIKGIFYTSDKRSFWPPMVCALIILLALLLTQTRNTLITITLSTITAFFVASSLEKDKEIRKKQYLHFIYAFLGIIISIVIFSLLSIEFQTRFQISSDINIEEGGSLTGLNSFASRIFIWITALNAFQSSPLIGIGMYTFPLTSANYSTIDPVLFNLFVEGLSTHITYLTILTEAGIIGLSGFIFMNIFLIRRYYKVMQEKVNIAYRRQFVFSLSIYIYILYSMFFSDFWLFGNGIVIWAFVFGYINNTIIEAKNVI